MDVTDCAAGHGMLVQMIKINWGDFFAQNVVFGIWTTRRSSLTKGKQWSHSCTWDWAHWENRFPNRKIPWHRCWSWKQRAEWDKND